MSLILLIHVDAVISQIK